MRFWRNLLEITAVIFGLLSVGMMALYVLSDYAISVWWAIGPMIVGVAASIIAHLLKPRKGWRQNGKRLYKK